MKKALYIMGSLEIMLGALLVSLASIVKNTLPTLGRVAFQAAMKGSYSPMEYEVSFLISISPFGLPEMSAEITLL